MRALYNDEGRRASARRPSDVPNLMDSNFGCIELLSREDMNVEIWSPEENAQFI